MTHDHRKLAIEFHRRIWELLDNKSRSEEEGEEMILAAHASLAHWMKAGTGVHHQRGEWMIARAYTELGRLEPAQHHFARTERLTRQHKDELADFDFAFLEALAARIAALGGDHGKARLHHVQATALGNALEEAEDRQIFFTQLAEEPWFGFKP